jgi:integrase
MSKLNDHSIISEQFSIALKILLHTGQRRGEIMNAEWEEVDLEQGVWFIPAPKNKAGRDHLVYLTPTVVQFFNRLKTLSYGSEWVIPSKSCSEKPFSERALTRAVNRAQEKFGLKKWVPHDLRRTFVSGVNGIGGEIHVTEKIVNHALEGMLKVYDVGDYDEQKKKTMLMWESHLNALCNDAELSRKVDVGA